MRETQYRRYLLAVLLVIQAFNGVDGLALGLVLQNIKADLHLSDTQLGFLSGIAFALFYSVMGIPIARWADRGNRVTIISLTTAVWSVMVALCGTAASFAQLLLIRVGVAIGEAGCIPPAHSLIADHFNRAERPRAVAFYMLAGSVSTLIGYFVAGWLNEFFGWRTMFILIGLPGILPAALARLTLREPRQQKRESRGARQHPSTSDSATDAAASGGTVPSLREVLATLWRNQTFRSLLLSLCVLSFFVSGILQWQPAFFVRSFHLETGELGTWFAIIYGGASFAGTYWGGELASRRAAQNEPLQLRAMALLIASIGLLSTLLYLSYNRYVAFGLLGLGVLGGCAANGPLFAIIQTLVPERMRALSIATIYLFTNLIGAGLGPLAVGTLSDALRPQMGDESLRYALLALCPGYVWSGWYLWRAARTITRDLGQRDVSSPDRPASIAHRYRRALQRTAPKEAATTPATVVEGYWLDEHRFFFLAERRLPCVAGVTRAASIADCRTNTVREVVSLEKLASLIAAQAGTPADVEALASAEFDLSEQGVLTVSAAGQDYRVDTPDLCLLDVKPSAGIPVLRSPDGRYGCFVKGNDLWVQELSSGAERPLTRDGATDFFYGRPSQTTLAGVSASPPPRPEGLWSPDSRWFLTLHLDERAVPEQALIQHAPRTGRPVLYRYKYPIPQDPLPIAVFVAVEVSSGRIVRFSEFPTPLATFSPFHLRRVWFADAGNAWFLRQDRYCREAELIALDLERGTGRPVVQERVSSGYLDFNSIMIATPNVRTLTASQEVIWYSERDGWGHLYLHDASTGRMKNQITRGEWLVRDIVHVDERQRTVLLLAGGVDPKVDRARRSLCRVNLDGTGFEVLLKHDGDLCVPVPGPYPYHPGQPGGPHVGIAPDADHCVVRFTSVDRGNSAEIVSLRSMHRFAIATALPDPEEIAPRPFVSTAADGVTRLHGCLFLPPNFDATHRYPLIDFIYPGPQVAHQPQAFQSMSSAPARTLAQLGFITLMLDTRGLPIGSRAFHQVGYGNLLEPQLADHAAVVRDLCKRLPFIDDRRIGIVGHSAGGAAAARAMFDYATLFKVGVAVCGNHDPQHYAAIWADKYCGPDDSSRAALCNNSVAAHNLQGHLLLVAADLDDNVPLSQTLGLVDALIRANRTFDLLIVPNADHGAFMTHGYTQRRVWDYLVRNLLGEEPPEAFAVDFSRHELDCLRRRCLQERL